MKTKILADFKSKLLYLQAIMGIVALNLYICLQEFNISCKNYIWSFLPKLRKYVMVKTSGQVTQTDYSSNPFNLSNLDLMKVCD